LDASKTVGFKVILRCKPSVNLSWMSFLFVEKLNDHSLLISYSRYVFAREISVEFQTIGFGLMIGRHTDVKIFR
jgi:hypothetical protein